MKRIIFTFIVLIFLADSACAKVFLDGKDWKNLNEFSDKMAVKMYKRLIVRGIYDGVWFAGEKGAKYMYWPEGDLDFGLIEDGLDHFYSDYRNIKIPIVNAIPVIILEIKGEDPQKIEGLKRELRREPLQ